MWLQVASGSLLSTAAHVNWTARSVWLQVASGSLLSTAARVNWTARWIAFSSFTSHRSTMCSDSVNTSTILITGNHFTETIYPSPRQHTMKVVSIALLCTGVQCRYCTSTLTKHKFMSVFGVAVHYIASIVSRKYTCQNMYIPGATAAIRDNILGYTPPAIPLFSQLLWLD